MMDKHAYMIMAHHRPDLLQLLLDALDDKRNDIIIHLDKKSSLKPEQFHVQNAKLNFVDRMNVNWAGYTQVECEYCLLKRAVELGTHSYYHFLTGSNYPLWNQEYLHAFFQANNTTEYIGFDNGMDYSIRAKFYIPFSEYGKLVGITGKMIQVLRQICLATQKILGFDRLKREPMIIKKGCAYFSITEGMTKEIISKANKMRSLLKKTIWCDEVFVQTIAYNSQYRENIYDFKNEWDGCMRDLAWPSNIAGEHPGWNFSMSDLDYLLNSNRLFAMKFESEDGIEVIKAIKEKRNIS